MRVPCSLNTRVGTLSFRRRQPQLAAEILVRAAATWGQGIPPALLIYRRPHAQLARIPRVSSCPASYSLARGMGYGHEKVGQKAPGFTRRVCAGTPGRRFQLQGQGLRPTEKSTRTRYLPNWRLAGHSPHVRRVCGVLPQIPCCPEDGEFDLPIFLQWHPWLHQKESSLARILRSTLPDTTKKTLRLLGSSSLASRQGSTKQKISKTELQPRLKTKRRGGGVL